MARMLICIAIINCFAFPTHAHAYLDPGTGSIILQGLLAAFVAGGMYLRSVREYIKSFFVSSKPTSESVERERDGVNKG